MKFYSTIMATDQPRFFATLAEARKAAREHADSEREEVEIERGDVRTDREGILRLLNQAGGYWITDDSFQKIIVRPRGGKD